MAGQNEAFNIATVKCSDYENSIPSDFKAYGFLSTDICKRHEIDIHSIECTISALTISAVSRFLWRQKCNCKMGVADYHINGQWNDDGWDCKIIPAKELIPKEQIFIQKVPLRKVFK